MYYVGIVALCIATSQQCLSGSFLPEGDEDVGDGLEGGEEGEHDPVHHPFHLKQKFSFSQKFVFIKRRWVARVQPRRITQPRASDFRERCGGKIVA